MISGSQIRAARAALKLSIDDLARLSGVSSRTIKRMEAEEGIPSSTRPNMHAIVSTLETAGIEFIGTPDEGPGIRLWKDRGPAAHDAAPGSA
jgi:transcriptional regulator with XRE-family HTH domain